MMYWNHLKFAARLFLKEKFYSFLNVIGLVIGITCGLIVLIYLQNDLTYDQHNTNHKRIYRFTQHLQATGANLNVARVSSLLPPLLKEDIPELEAYVRFEAQQPQLVTSYRKDGSEVKFTEELIFKVDSNVFSVFTHRFIAGNPSTSLVGGNKAVITASVADKYWVDEPALDKTLMLAGEPYTVTGVIEDIPHNTHLKFDVLISGMDRPRSISEGEQVRFSQAFWNPDVYGYLLFQEGYNTDKFYELFPSIFDKYYSSFAKIIDGKCTPYLERLDQVHFYSDKSDDQPQGSIGYVYAFSTIGLFIVLLACINYMNLATARSVERTAEMGVRKAMGNSRRGLFMSIISEAMLSAMIAMIVSVGLCYFILHATGFNDLIGKQLKFDLMANPLLLPGIVVITLIIGLFSGVYPALYIPSVPVVKALKGNFKSQTAGILLRKFLITFQFLISILVIICTSLMGDQIAYMRDKDLGFENENVVVLGIADTIIAKQIPEIRETLTSHHNITSATFAYGRPGMGVESQVFMIEEDGGEMVQQGLHMIYAGHDYLETMSIELIDGRDFNPDFQSEYLYSYIVNESAVKHMGWGDEALGKKMTYFNDDQNGQVIGVVKDFNYLSLHNKIDPLVIILDNEIGGWLHVKIKGEGIQQTMSFIEEQWKSYFPNVPYEYEFMDKGFDKQYKADEKQYRLVAILSYVCIVLSIMGLIGLSTFTAGQKTKEIGVRKVLGASVYHILLLFSRDYIKLIIIAFFIAVPVANYIIQEWLKAFAYPIGLGWLPFVLPGLLILFISLMAVASQSLSAARANPVNAIKSE